ncbi:zinc finger MYND domain-containing protein 12 isoform X1 [Mauremys mutica]|uniref:zinc finger MYND domain-containing protein 12 isoform X1 n=1 Tax=Mauremys mutica TaxID=74926 RepID=UPI001D16CF09|nr:zinc finger MYND domain-containing protein 12 isoform X1 [Mauremys mutica]
MPARVSASASEVATRPRPGNAQRAAPSRRKRLVARQRAASRQRRPGREDERATAGAPGAASGAAAELRAVRRPGPAALRSLPRHLLLKHLVDFTHKVAQKFVFEGKHEEAIPAALHSLRFSIDTCGPDSVELVPAYLILAEASTGLGHLTQAEEYLSQAQWIVLKTSDCSNGIQSKLHRNLGLLYAAKGNFEESLYHLATDIYFASCAFGTHDISTSGGYFHMANVFFRQNKMDIADSLYTEVTDIWHAHFSRLIQVQSQTLTSPAEINILSEEEEISEEPLNEAQQAEASQVLNAILDIREQAPKQQPAKTANVVHALAMLHYLILDLPKAHELGMKAFLITKQLPNQDASEAINHLLKLIKSKLFYTK